MKRYIFSTIILTILLTGCVTKPVDFAVNSDIPTAVINETPAVSATSSVPNEQNNKVSKPTTTNRVVVAEKPPVTTTTKPVASVDYLALDVPFAAQAPYQVWDALHEEACEEAAIIMAAKYFANEPIDPHIAEQAILSLIKWEETQGYQVDLTANDAVKILVDYFHLKASVSSEVSSEKIINEIVKGNLVIIPAAGRLLYNPNFKSPGPIYHMLVVKGYDKKLKQFITNDPGTRKGNGYRYDFSVLINAVHDWDHELAKDGMTDVEIESTRKVVIIVSKP